MPAVRATTAHKLTLKSVVVAVFIGLAIAAALFGLFAWFVATYIFPGPSESLSKYPKYRASFGSGAYAYMPASLPVDDAEAAVLIWHGALQAGHRIQLRLVWNSQSDFDTEYARLDGLDRTDDIREKHNSDDASILMAYPHDYPPSLQWITDLEQWLGADPDRHVLLMSGDRDLKPIGAVAVCPSSRTIFYFAEIYK
ncbi:MAG: hypothetical protein ACIAQF_06055 [Phycisphaerales bacterium JB065]